MPGNAPAPHDDSVSPVVGTVLLLGIFAVASAAVLLVSGPLLERLQGQSATHSVLGDITDLHDASLALAGPDSQRTLTVTNARGSLGVAPEGAMLLLYDTDASGTTTCDFRLTGWHDTGAGSLTFTTSGCPAANAGGCGAGVCVDAARVLGGAVQPISSTSNAGSITFTSDTLGTDDWRFRLVDTSTDPDTAYAEAWLVRSDSVHWEDSTTGASVDAWMGMVFSDREATRFADRDFPFEPGSGGALQVIRIVSYKGDPPAATNEGGAHRLGLRLADRALRSDMDGAGTLATHVRFEFTGDLARHACLALAFADNVAAGGTHVEDPSLPCTGGQAVTAVTYDEDSSAPTTDSFPLEVSHARVRVRLD